MSFDDPFASDGMWLRCALHAHTTNSDGELAPERLAAHYARAGYDVLCITDHWVRTLEESDDILCIPGIELNAVTSRGSDAHVLALGSAADPIEPGREFAGLQETVDWIVANGGVPFVAHPYWSGLRFDELVGCNGLLGIEVYNAGCQLEIGRGLSGVHWDDCLEDGARFLALATDDSHLPGFDSGFASVWVRVAERTQQAVLDALRTGRFYSSTGPRIESVTVVDGAVEVRCSPAASVALVAARTRGAKVNAGRMGYRSDGRVTAEDDEGRIVAARLERPRSLPYGRVEVTHEHGGTAWSNPLWFD